MLRLKGERSLEHNFAGEKAERLFGEALSVARREGLRWLELRAGSRLADVLCGGGRHAEARELLAPVTEWFTEGKTLPDFKAALEVLERAQQSRLH